MGWREEMVLASRENIVGAAHLTKAPLDYEAGDGDRLVGLAVLGVDDKVKLRGGDFDFLPVQSREQLLLCHLVSGTSDKLLQSCGDSIGEHPKLWRVTVELVLA